MNKMVTPRRKRRQLFFLTVLFICTLLAVPAETFHFHADGHAHNDCSVCLNAFILAELTAPPLPAIGYCGFRPLPPLSPDEPLQRIFTGSNQLSCGPPRG